MAYTIETQNGIVTFTIDRPHIRNAVNEQVMEGLEELAIRAREQDIRFVIITATGEQAFCSGGDLSVFHELKTEQQAWPMLNRMGQALYRIKTIPVPVIALINGTAVGGGCEIATACDYRLVRSHAKCGFIQGTLAITSGWGGGTYLFEAIKHDAALKMLSDSRAYSSAELLENGWASAVIEEDGDIGRFLASMDRVLPSVHRAYKAMAVRKWQETNLKQRVDEEIRECARLWAEEAHHLAVDGFLNKNKK